MNKRILAYLLTLLAALTATLLLIAVVMNPPMGDLIELGRLLAVTAVISGGVGYLTYRMGLWRQFRSLSQALAVSYLIAAGLTLLNVWATARLMFINQHDLSLAILLLLFAAGVSVAFGIFIAGSSIEALNQLAAAARQVSQGNLAARVPEEGQDEIAQLSAVFNEMVRKLEGAVEKERALDEARRDLVAWASHDLRTPLASLRAMNDALVEGVVRDEATERRYLHQSQQEIGRMSRMLDDLFELAQLDTGGMELSLEPASLADLVSDALEAFTVHARSAGVNLSGRAQSGMDPILMAPDKVSRVLNNLIENALRHTPQGGEVVVTAEPGGSEAVVAISDTGSGIDPEDRPRIFERFFRSERSRSRTGYERGGTGLGLAISKGIVEAHGGSIWLDESHTQGTRIVFSLPYKGR